jgi:arabinogalactan endo-1,4-beta-galactosidase
MWLNIALLHSTTSLITNILRIIFVEVSILSFKTSACSPSGLAAFPFWSGNMSSLTSYLFEIMQLISKSSYIACISGGSFGLTCSTVL